MTIAVEDIGGRLAEVDAPDRYLDRFRLASSISKHCGQAQLIRPSLGRQSAVWRPGKKVFHAVERIAREHIEET
jgi:hypothetical protein